MHTQYILLVTAALLVSFPLVAQQKKKPSETPAPAAKPAVPKPKPAPAATPKKTVKILPDADCIIRVDGEEKARCQAGQIAKIYLPSAGIFYIEVISDVERNAKYTINYEVTDFKDDLLEVRLPVVSKTNSSTPAAPTSGSSMQYTDPLAGTFVRITSGAFDMGSNDGDINEKPVHRVTLNEYYLGKYEVTVAQFKAFVDDTGYQTDAEKGDGSYAWTGSTWEKKTGVDWRCDVQGNRRPSSAYNHPVIHVSWNDATAYAQWLSRKTGERYRLPTEAEWEYAAGNGSRHTKYSWGNGDPSGKRGGNVGDETIKAQVSSWSYSIFSGYTDGYVFTAPVGLFDPNDFGLHDMTGNVWEWCSDWYGSDYYGNSPAANPTGPTSGSNRVIRGGSWDSDPPYCRVAYRNGYTPDVRGSDVGFRLARTF